jgi:hypothetical protein
MEKEARAFEAGAGKLAVGFRKLYKLWHNIMTRTL